MSHYIPENEPIRYDAHGGHEEEAGNGWKHWGLMLLCCLPMIAIPVLILLGVWTIR